MGWVTFRLCLGARGAVVAGEGESGREVPATAGGVVSGSPVSPSRGIAVTIMAAATAAVTIGTGTVRTRERV